MMEGLCKCVATLVVLMLMARQVNSKSKCSWSNEDCSEDGDCCSKSCHQNHVGTNSRCRHSSLMEKCIFDYHCQNQLECGSNFTCCSPYWTMCVKDDHCCNTLEHKCRAEEGFIYHRCLFPSSAHVVSLGSWWLVTLMSAVLLHSAVKVTFGTGVS